MHLFAMSYDYVPYTGGVVHASASAVAVGS
jgi:hypothetical protein